jgi:hypothetical protein
MKLTEIDLKVHIAKRLMGLHANQDVVKKVDFLDEKDS